MKSGDKNERVLVGITYSNKLGLIAESSKYGGCLSKSYHWIKVQSKGVL